MGRRRYTPPFEVEIEYLGKGGVGVGLSPEGVPVEVKPAPPGGRILFAPGRKKKGKWSGRRVSLVRPPEEYVPPVCDVFGLCGGCVLQELSLEAQRRAKAEYALRQVAGPMGLSVEALEQQVELFPVRGADEGFHYRNKVEFSFGTRRILSQADFDAKAPIGGRFLGFHAAGRFDRIADAKRCWLVSEGVNALLGSLRESALGEEQPMPWDTHTHQGFWRHAMVREGFATGELLLSLFTAPAQRDEEVEAVEALVATLFACELPEGKQLVGVVWFENASVADVAKGAVRQVWGRDWLEEKLGPIGYRISTDTFFQTSTEGAVLLYDAIAEALAGISGGRLYDLYCGIGSIGLYLASQFDEIVGVEEVEASVENARENAQRNGIEGARYWASKMEDALEILQGEAEQQRVFVVDPPRAGLHPKVLRTLAQTPAEALIYVACHPGSLGRDGAVLELGRWSLQKLWIVDLFPQTGHIEMVAQFLPQTALDGAAT